ncbi:O-antigen polymerase [Pedobacter sp. AW31-3R]|uniref:O-antigen polymerase n=1 Tax=Pedobacter sp. AW31-3R TaxID=3445781 RepID=UPI003FA00528
MINPFAVYSIFLYTAGYSFLNFADKQITYSSLFIAFLSVSVFFFILGGWLSQRTTKFSLENFFPSITPRFSFGLLLGLFIAGVVVFVMEIRQLGYLPLLNLNSMSVYDDLNENAVSALHNLVVLNAVLPAMFYILYKKQCIPSYIFLILAFLSCFILINFFSRQMLILLFFSLLLAVNYFNKVPLLKLLLIGIVTVVVFIGLGELRSSSTEDSSAAAINDVIKGYTGIKKPTNLLETYLSLYGAVNFSTADQLINLSSKDGYVGWGRYTLRPVITPLPIDKSIVYPLQYSSYNLLGTYLVDPFMDFRWPGVIVLNFLYGFLSMNSFKNYLSRKSPYYIVEWALFMFCLFMCSFTNFFHMFFVVFFFIVNRIAFK